MAKGDSGASDHYFRPCDAKCLTNIKSEQGAPILLPDKSSISSSHTGLLPNLHLSKIGRTVKILPHLRSASLISVGKLCDDGCRVHFDETKMKVHKNEQLIMTGTRNEKDGLYDIPIEKVNLSQDHFKMPRSHPALYKNRSRKSTISGIKKQLWQADQRINLLSKAFPCMHILASHNECDQMIAD